MNTTHSRRFRFGLLAGTVALLTAVGTSAPALAAPTGPEIAVTASVGVFDRGFTIRNEGNTTIPAGTKFTFQSNAAVSIGLFGDSELNQDWNIGVAGSGQEADVYLKAPLIPGQTKKLSLSPVEVSAFTKYTLTLTDPDIKNIDTNVYNNSATINCTINFFGLAACTAS